MNPKSVKFGFEITRYPNKKREKKLKFQFTLFMDLSIGLIITVGQKEHKMVNFEDTEDLKLRGAGFGLTSEDISLASRIMESN
jgi:hypothetical protein